MIQSFRATLVKPLDNNDGNILRRLDYQPAAMRERIPRSTTEGEELDWTRQREREIERERERERERGGCLFEVGPIE